MGNFTPNSVIIHTSGGGTDLQTLASESAERILDDVEQGGSFVQLTVSSMRCEPATIYLRASTIVSIQPVAVNNANKAQEV